MTREDALAAAVEAKDALGRAYLEQSAALMDAAIGLSLHTVDELAASGAPVPHVGGPRLRPYEEALDRALMAL